MDKPLVLVVDMQNVYSNNQKWECKNYGRALKNICELLEEPRMNGVFTRYIADKNAKGVWRDYNRENAEVNSDEWLNELYYELREGYKYIPCYDKSEYLVYYRCGTC